AARTRSITCGCRRTRGWKTCSSADSRGRSCSDLPIAARVPPARPVRSSAAALLPEGPPTAATGVGRLPLGAGSPRSAGLGPLPPAPARSAPALADPRAGLALAGPGPADHHAAGEGDRPAGSGDGRLGLDEGHRRAPDPLRGSSADRVLADRRGGTGC